MRPSALLLTATLVVLATHTTGVVLDLSVDVSNRSYSLFLDGRPWLNSSAAGWALRSNGLLLQSGGLGGLDLASAIAVTGSSPLGSYTGWNFTFNSASSPGLYQASIQVYDLGLHDTTPAFPFVVFGQSFPLGVVGTALGNSTADAADAATAFPNWGPPLPQLDSDLAYLTYQGATCPPHLGRWTVQGLQTGAWGSQGGAVTALFNASMATVVMSPLTDIQTQRAGFAPSLNNTFAVGFNGKLDGIPAGWSAQSVLVAGAGLDATMHAWGDVLLAVGGKARTRPDSDNATAYLSYWTDNGAYYYYHTAPNVTYEQTMLAVKDYLLNEAQLPVQTGGFQFDSWWYFKEAIPNDPLGTALLLWEPMPSVFPSGMAPWLGLPLALHNRFFADWNNYTAMGYEFIREPGAGISLPIDKRMFLYMLGKAKAWGMTMYEQDWLNIIPGALNAPLANITAAHTWLHAMGDALAELNLTAQYCLPLPSHILASTAIPPVTNARATGDYHPGDYHDAVNHWDNWNIQVTSLLYDAVGIQPSKDDFWTTEVQPGNPYGTSPSGDTEPNTVLHTLAAALSTGPVGPSDGIGYANVSLIMATCRAGDGLLLKPDRPLITLDAAIRTIFTTPQGGALSGYSPPNVSLTYSSHGGRVGQQWRWGYLLAADLQEAFTLSVEDVAGSPVAPGALAGNATSWAVFDFFAAPASQPVAMLDPAQPFTIPVGQGLPGAPANAHPIRFYTLAPVLPGGWVLAGETAKFATMSRQRLDGFVASASGFSASVSVADGEAATFVVYAPGHGAGAIGSGQTVACIGANGSGPLTLACSSVSSPACICN